MKQEALYRRLSARICRIFSSAEASNPFDSERVYINLSRYTFRRVPYYMTTGMWIINEKGKNEFKRFSKVISFDETEEDCLLLIEVINEVRKYMDKKKLSIEEDSIEIANYIDDLLIYAFKSSK